MPSRPKSRPDPIVQEEAIRVQANAALVADRGDAPLPARSPGWSDAALLARTGGHPGNETYPGVSPICAYCELSCQSDPGWLVDEDGWTSCTRCSQDPNRPERGAAPPREPLPVVEVR